MRTEGGEKSSVQKEPQRNRATVKANQALMPETQVPASASLFTSRTSNLDFLSVASQIESETTPHLRLTFKCKPQCYRGDRRSRLPPSISGF